MEVQLADNEDAMYMKSATTVSERVCHICGYRQAYSIVRMQDSEDPAIPICYASLCRLISLCLLSHMYCLEYFGEGLSVTFHPATFVEVVPASLAAGMLLGYQVLPNSTEVV